MRRRSSRRALSMPIDADDDNSCDMAFEICRR